MKLNLEHKTAKYTGFAERSAKILYWLILLTLSVFNFLIFLALVPFMLILEEFHLFVIISALGMLFGFIFSFLIKDIEHLRPHHHIFAAIFIPLISIVNIILLISLGNFLRPDKDEIIIASALYVAFFAVPYALSELIKRRRN